MKHRRANMIISIIKNECCTDSFKTDLLKELNDIMYYLKEDIAYLETEIDYENAASTYWAYESQQNSMETLETIEIFLGVDDE